MEGRFFLNLNTDVFGAMTFIRRIALSEKSATFRGYAVCKFLSSSPYSCLCGKACSLQAFSFEGQEFAQIKKSCSLQTYRLKDRNARRFNELQLTPCNSSGLLKHADNPQAGLRDLKVPGAHWGVICMSHIITSF